jgi:hypothetical protein
MRDGIKKDQMLKTLYGSAAVFVILIFALVAPAGVVTAQQGEPVPDAVESQPTEVVAPEAAAPEPAADDGLSEDDIRQILINDSNARFTSWKRRRGYINAKECGDYNGVDGPTKPSDVYCDPADIPAEQIELYRETQRQQNSTFLNEPAVKF